MDTFAQDVRFAARLLRRSPVFTLTAALSIAVGVGADTAVFSLANALLFRPPAALRAPAQLVDISPVNTGQAIIGFFSYTDYVSASERFRTFDGVYAHDLVPKPMNVIVDGIAERVSGNVVTANYFDVLGVGASTGRLFQAGTGRASPDRVVVLSDRYWTRRFNRSPSVAGRPITLNGQAFTVAGVAAAGFQGTTVLAPDVWVPIDAALTGPMASGPQVLMGGRLKPGVSIAQARDDVRSVGLALRRDDRFSGWDDAQVTRVAAIPAHALPIGPFLAILLAAVSLVLAIACANLTSSLLARTAARQGEFAIRTALGAGRRHIARQVLIETALLFLIGGTGGVVLAQWVAAAATTLLPSLPLPVGLTLTVDWRVFAFALALALAAGLFSGLLPALRASHTRIRVETHRLRHAFLVAQIALAIVLVVAAGLLGRALRHATAVDAGYDTRGVEYAPLDLSLAGITGSRAAAFTQQVRDRVQRIPAVASVAVAATVPMGDPIMGLGGVTRPGEPLPERRQAGMALGNVVEPGYFATMRIPLVAGRDFAATDTASGEPVAIIGEATARRLWGDVAAVGKQIVVYQSLVDTGGGGGRRLGNATTRRVVGVARDVKYASLADGPAPTFVYVPMQQQPTAAVTLIVRGNGSASLGRELQAAVTSLNPTVPVAARSAEGNLAVALMPQRIAALVSGTLGVVGLLLAALGIYGLMAYTVARRTREIAVRVAVGAAHRDVIRLILRQGLGLAAVGGGLGLALAAGVSGVLRTLLFGVPPLDPVAFGGTALLFAAVTLLACYLPARRATRIEPAEALRQT